MRSGGAEGLPRGVRSDADIGRARIICPGFRLDWIMFGESGGAVGHEVVTPSFSVRQIPPHCAASLAGALQRTHAREEAFSKRQTQEHILNKKNERSSKDNFLATFRIRIDAA